MKIKFKSMKLVLIGRRLSFYQPFGANLTKISLIFDEMWPKIDY